MDAEVVLETSIKGVTLTKKSVFRDKRGAVLHMIKSSSKNYNNDFGEIYFSKVKKGIIKGWKLHKEFTQRLIVPHGSVKFVIIDHRESSPSYGLVETFELSEENYFLLTIKPYLTYGFIGVSNDEALIANLSSGSFRKSESITYDLNDSKLCQYTKYF